ncbi:Uncharacterised protein [Mycobacteroides abscessus subsp. abscessus]|nr:Uncharacterised protein [Mycobacteroides abscessus subsp. abscessus]
MSVGEHRARLECAPVQRRVLEPASSGQVGFEVAGPRREVHQEGVDLIFDLERPIVIGARRIEGGNAICGADREVFAVDCARRPAHPASSDEYCGCGHGEFAQADHPESMATLAPTR